jgi:hypothetical protein
MQNTSFKIDKIDTELSLNNSRFDKCLRALRELLSQVFKETLEKKASSEEGPSYITYTVVTRTEPRQLGDKVVLVQVQERVPVKFRTKSVPEYQNNSVDSIKPSDSEVNTKFDFIKLKIRGIYEKVRNTTVIVLQHFLNIDFGNKK